VRELLDRLGGSLTLGGLDFAAPWVLALLLLLPWLWWWRRRRRRGAIVFSRAAVLARGPRAGQRVVRALSALRFVALAGCVVALARPRTGARAETSTSEGIDIVVAFDISSSMLAEDFQPNNRLEVAKARIKEFVANRQSDRIAIVPFAAEALTQVPLTTDYPVVLAAVDAIQSGQLEDGTAIGTAITTAANRLRASPGRSRVIILMTDGENNRGTVDPRTAAKAAAQFGIRIYTVGVGTEGMAPVPVGRGLFGLRYENRPVEIDDALLTEVAQTTGGRYFRATSAEALDRITREIDRLERTPVKARTYVRFTELYRWPLGAAMLALTLELALLARRGPLP
jgi:Ca-activated chloride channel family protein